VLSSGADGKAPDIVKVANTGDGELGNFALPAHIDHQWTPLPSSGSFLYALEVPQHGGETQFTNRPWPTSAWTTPPARKSTACG
jgi:taurine dioxygenase